MNVVSRHREVGEFKKRYKWMALFVVLVFVVLYSRMVHLQLIEHDHYAAAAQENITRSVSLPATRGIVRDASGNVLATNRPSYDVYLTPMLANAEVASRLGSLMGSNKEEVAALIERLDKVPPQRRNHQIRFFSDISREQLAALETHRSELPGLDIVARPVRTYPFGALGAHAIGYLNEITERELETLDSRGYEPGALIGRSGLERAWERDLRGVDGLRRTEARMAAVQPDAVVEERKPEAGHDLHTTLNMDLMAIVDRAFRGYPAGAAVIVDVRNGDVLALFSKPAYDLNVFTAGLSTQDFDALKQDPFRPLIDKTMFEAYFPGSTFKPFSALAGLEDASFDATLRTECTGSYLLGKTRFRCTAVHGDVDLQRAMVQSCNVYFYRLAEHVGLDRIARVAKNFGLGHRTGVGINAEADGLIPTRAWYRKRKKYRLGFTLNTAIGQGDTKITLMQLAMAYAAIANGGDLYRPRLVSRVVGKRSRTVRRFEPHVLRRVKIDPRHLEIVRHSLRGVVNDPLGTAYDARVEDGVPAAGKTGTAQITRRPGPGEQPTRAWFTTRAHAWFAGFAPYDDPKVAIALLLEHGGAGGKNAAPVALQILDRYLQAQERDSDAPAE